MEIEEIETAKKCRVLVLGCSRVHPFHILLMLHEDYRSHVVWLFEEDALINSCAAIKVFLEKERTTV